MRATRWTGASLALALVAALAAGGHAQPPAAAPAPGGTSETSTATPGGSPEAGRDAPRAPVGETAAAPAEGATPPAEGAGATPGGEGQATVPWSDAEAVALPSFLDTTDRRVVDDRPGPTPEQVAALREMEAEVDRFDRTASSYRDTVVSLLRREYLRQRRGRDEWYGHQIREEERMLDEARENAIRVFERFVRRYPDDPRYSPDAMFRLGELYFERSAVLFQQAYDQAQAAREAGQDPGETQDSPDFQPTIELYQQLVRQFPDYERIDGVLYLIGYCLNEMGRPDEALKAWLALVCANKHRYDPDAIAAETAAAAQAAQAADEQAPGHPALGIDPQVAPNLETGVFVDPYTGCEPVRAEARFLSETWFRVGEYHFDDYGDLNALDLAIAAYNQILADTDDRNYNLALYKVAWAYYRASRYPEAIRYFGMLVQWSDDERQRTGRAGSELRPEAIQYLGIAFAYDDWNENQVPDTQEGQPSGIDRVQSATLLPQDRAWTPDVYFQLGQVYFDEAKYPEAIRVWRLALERWPGHHLAPEYTNQIAIAHQRHNEFEAAIAARAELTQYTEGSEWYNANVDHPIEQRRAEELAENALIATAIHHHSNAQRLRRRCVEERAPDLCRQAQEQYSLAGQAYRGYLERYPNNPQAYELHYNLADALYWSSSYEEAAAEYAAVRDSNLDDSHLAESARLVVESLKRIVDQAVAEGRVTVRDEAPPVEGTPPRVRPVQMPELVQRLAQARELYLARVPEAQDSEQVRGAYDFNNALLLYFYGYWSHAKQRLERIFDERCSGPMADETGQVAWLNLRQMAVATQDDAEISRLATLLQQRRCTFSHEEGEAPAQVDCSQPDNRDNPFCLVQSDLNALQYRAALAIYAEAEHATGDDQRGKYERAASMLIQAVNENPGDPQAPVALEYAATALERTSRFESAARLYQRIIDEVGPRQGADAEEQARLDAIMANAYFRLAFNANRFFEFDRAVESYRVLADSPRFARSQDPIIAERRTDGLVNAAIIMERLGRTREATEYYRRVVATVQDPEIKRTAAYRIAEIAFDSGNWSNAVREMQGFIQRYQSDSNAGEPVVQAYWRIAQARKNANQERDYLVALQDVVNAYERTRQQPGSIAAEYAAEAKFRLVDQAMPAFERFAVNPGRPPTLQQYVQNLIAEVQRGSREGQALKESYDPLMAYRRPTWTIAAYVRQGRAYEILVRGILNAPFVMPADLQRQIRGAGTEAREDIRIQVEDRVRQVLEEQIRPIECFAIERYALAARAARAGSMDNEFTRLAIDRLQAYGEERIAECIAEAQARDNSFQAYQSGEFRRAPRGQTVDIRVGVSPPSLAGGDR